MRAEWSRCAPPTASAQIWILVAAAFLIAIGFGIVAPTLPVFVRSFDVGVTAVSLAVSIFALSRLLFAPLAGRFVGKARGRSARGSRAGR
jgi:MFS family permease